MKTTELRNLTDDELDQRYNDLEKELLHLRMQQATSQLEKPSRLHDLRRDRARMLTIMNERKRVAHE